MPDDTDLALKVQLLQIHIAAVHNSEGGQVCTPGSTTTDDAIEQTKVERQEHGDGTIAAAYKAPRNSSPSRSKKSRKRTKSRKPAVSSSGEMATMLC